MTFLVAWIALPALLGLISLGAGFVVERLAVTRLRAPLLVTAGFAAISVGGQLATLTSNTAASAQATFAGYTKLDDTATYLAMSDRA
jgi:hypothetical protein